MAERRRRATRRLWGGDAVDVTLVERDDAFVSCPLSNLVLGGSSSIADMTVPYAALARRGVKRHP